MQKGQELHVQPNYHQQINNGAGPTASMLSRERETTTASSERFDMQKSQTHCGSEAMFGAAERQQNCAVAPF